MPRKPLIKKLDLYGVVDVGSTDPSTAESGELFYNTTSSQLKIYISGAWAVVGSGTATIDGVFITEDGDYIMTEDGDNLAYN